MNFASRSSRKRYLFGAAILAAFAFIFIAHPYTIEVGIIDIVKSETKQVSNLNENNFIARDYDVYNSGSAGYIARLRLDIYNATSKQEMPLATIWSSELAFLPGDRKTLSVYWYGGNLSGNFTAKTSIYRAHEIESAGQFSISLVDKSAPKDVFAIEKARVYDSTINLRVKSSEDAKDVIIYPLKYPAGWLFEQEKIGDVEKNGNKWVNMRYDPALFREAKITIAIVGNHGTYYSEQVLELKKEKGFMKYWHLVEDAVV